MTEDEWFETGAVRFSEWSAENVPFGGLTLMEKDAFDYGWELAGREMGIVK